MSRSSTESEIISLDAGLRVDGIPAVDLWDEAREVMHSSNNRKSSTQGAAGHCALTSSSGRPLSKSKKVDEQVQGNPVRGEIRSTDTKTEPKC